MRRLATTIGLLVVVVGCGDMIGSGSPTRPGAGGGSGEPAESDGTSTASPQPLPETVDWDRSEVAYENCPPDAAPADTVAFGEPVGAELGDLGGVVRHGIVANREGELFRIDVFGRDDEFVRNYFLDLHLCLDAVFTAEAAEEPQEGPDAGDVRPDGDFGEEDLVIQLALLGFVDPAGDPGAIAKEIAPIQIDDWARTLERLEATPEAARPDLIANDYVVDAVIDPGMGLNVTHHYREIWSTRVFTRVTVSGGQVRAGLCRNSWSPLRAVTQSAGTAGDLSDTQASWFLYDLGVKGLTSSNRYMLTASWWIPGWNSGYWALAPSGGLKACYP
jgi:hypothetical protein